MSRLHTDMLLDIGNRPPIEQEAMLILLIREQDEWGDAPPVEAVSRQMELNALIRGEVRRNVRSALDMHDLDYDWQEYPGILFTTINLKIRTPTWTELTSAVDVLTAIRRTWG